MILWESQPQEENTTKETPKASAEAMEKAEQNVEALNQIEIDLHLDPGVLDIVRVPFNNLQSYS